MQDTSELIPHRGRWRIAQRVVSIDGLTAVCEGDFDEAFVDGHFPGQPIVPGVALLEGLAQSMLALSQTLAAAGAATEAESEGTPFLAGFDKVRFRAPVFPPATVTFTVKITEQRAGLTRASGTATWNGKRVCTAQLTGVVIAPPPEDGAPTA
ncbi:MAG: beta-hydroxyacyl-ACP dehydratase [Myxococcota bacterium]